MKRLMILILFLALFPLGAFAEGPAEDVMALFTAKDYAQLFALSDDTMREQIGTEENFAAIWAKIEAAFGEYVGYDAVTPADIAGYDAYDVFCTFANATVTLRLVFDADGKLAGLNIASYAMRASASDIEGGYVEEDVLLRKGAADETNGKITLPEGDGPFPCVIMMQGSGATDMNETAYGISVFAELAHMLAREGVASIRYDKYPYAHADLAQEDVSFDVDREYAWDAVAAMDLLSSDARIGDVYLLGHSLGAMIAPRVAAQIGAEKIAGMVLLAGSPLALHEILLRQLRDAETDAETIAAYQASFDEMWNMVEEDLRTHVVAGAPLSYWRNEAAYDYAGKIVEMGRPVFIAQGAKDFQVLPAEGIEAYEAALSGYEGATYMLYNEMNHLLCDMPGEMTGTVRDYENLSGVSQTLVSDIAQWIFAQ